MLKLVDASFQHWPHDIELEQAILAKVLIDNPSMDLLASVTPNDFYDEVHQALFAAMSEQWAEERAINLSTLKSVLENIPNIAPDVTPIEYIRRLTTFGDSRNTADLAVTLRELANRRRLIAAAIDLQNTRSEERRVGKEGRSRGRPDH